MVAYFPGLPHDGNLTPQIVNRRVGLLRRQVRAIADGEEVADPPMHLQQRAANHLRRVCREHQLDPQRLHRAGERVGRQALGAPARERIGARTGLRVVIRIARVVAAPADPVMLLRDVRQGQKLGERPRDRYRRRQRQMAQTIGQLRKRRRVAAMRALRQRARVLDQLEQRLAFEVLERLAEEIAQQPDIVAQCLVGIIHERQERLRRDASTRATFALLGQPSTSC